MGDETKNQFQALQWCWYPRAYVGISMCWRSWRTCSNCSSSCSTALASARSRSIPSDSVLQLQTLEVVARERLVMGSGLDLILFFVKTKILQVRSITCRQLCKKFSISCIHALEIPSSHIQTPIRSFFWFKFSQSSLKTRLAAHRPGAEKTHIFTTGYYGLNTGSLRVKYGFVKTWFSGGSKKYGLSTG